MDLFFNSSEFVLKKCKTTARPDGFLDTSLSGNKYLFYLGNITTSDNFFQKHQLL